MINLNNYIIEKLRINKNLKIDYDKYILIYNYQVRSSMTYIVKDSLKEIIEYMDTKRGKLGTFYIFKLPEELLEEFKNNLVIGTLDKLRKWCDKVGIKELKADDINNFRANEKN